MLFIDIMKEIPGVTTINFCSLHAVTASGITATTSGITELSTTAEGLSNGLIIAITFGTVTFVVSVISGIVVPIYIARRRGTSPGTQITGNMK